MLKSTALVIKCDYHKLAFRWLRDRSVSKFIFSCLSVNDGFFRASVFCVATLLNEINQYFWEINILLKIVTLTLININNIFYFNSWTQILCFQRPFGGHVSTVNYNPRQNWFMTKNNAKFIRFFLLFNKLSIG